MTEQEYIDKVQRIRRNIAGGRLEIAEQLLDEMYAYKPVRLLWFVAKAEYVLKKENDPERALKILEGKYFLGEDYPGLKECMKLRIKLFQQLGKDLDAVREDYCYQKARGKSMVRLEQELFDLMEVFSENPDNMETLFALGNAFYRVSDMAAHFITYAEWLRNGGKRVETGDSVAERIANFGYLEEKIRSDKPNTFILVMDGVIDRMLEILGHILHRSGHRVFLLTPPIFFETETCLELRDTLDISLEQMQQHPDMCVIPPVGLTQNSEPYGDNREYIIDYICKEKSGQDNAVLLCSGNLLEDLCIRSGIRGRIGRLSPYETDFLEEKVQFGWAGSYLSYISDLYGYDVRTDIDAEPRVDFSIVIPTRDSADTLRYTLQTCLNQRYTGSYEIVVSDNSADGSTAVYELCQELHDSRIRYIKTPRLFQLTKSFEFAYLQTRGKFILSMGSDDGLLPWGLEALHHVLSQFPKEDIILWERGFYAWPGFNGGQENMLEILQTYSKKFKVQYIESSQIFDWITQNQRAIYNMPLLYINSGFRRKYMKTMLEKTGKLWNGCNQDLQTGVINCCIHKRFLYMVFPITIAGMSSASIGYLVTHAPSSPESAQAKQTMKRLYQQDNLGIYVPLARERQVMLVGEDACAIYLTLSRAVEEGLLAEDKANGIFDWKTAVSNIFKSFAIKKFENYDCFVHVERFMAGNDTLRTWFSREIYHKVLVPRYFDHRTLAQKDGIRSYQEGTDSSGKTVLDASRYGVSDIAGAVQLFAEKTSL